MKNIFITIFLLLISLILICAAIYCAIWTDKGSDVWGWLLFVGLLFGLHSVDWSKIK